MKLDEEGDEIGLTNRITAGDGVGKSMSAASGSDENINGRSIVVQSSFVQESLRTR